MTIKDVRAKLKEIRAKAAEGDYEAAHSKEDDLFEAVLRYIAKDPVGELALLAGEALKSKRIKFGRYAA